MATLTSGEGLFHAGESVVQTESLKDMNKGVEERMDRLISNMESYFGFGGSAGKDIGKGVASNLVG
jgi:hypothetical protein